MYHRHERLDLIREDMYWIHVAQDQIQWRALLSAVMNLRGLYKELYISYLAE
jgi:hypothetical protein